MSDTPRGFQQLANGDVQLTMRPEDYKRFLILCGVAARAALAVENDPNALLTADQVFGFINRVLAGSPDHQPLETSEQERDHPYHVLVSDVLASG